MNELGNHLNNLLGETFITAKEYADLGWEIVNLCGVYSENHRNPLIYRIKNSITSYIRA